MRGQDVQTLQAHVAEPEAGLELIREAALQADA